MKTLLQTDPFLFYLERENPLLHPYLAEQPYLRGAEWVNATFQGLAQAAIGLFHALYLGRPEVISNSIPGKPPSPTLTRALLLQTPEPKSSLLLTSNSSLSLVREHCGSTDDFLKQVQKRMLSDPESQWGGSRLGTYTIILIPNLPQKRFPKTDALPSPCLFS